MRELPGSAQRKCHDELCYRGVLWHFSGGLGACVLEHFHTSDLQALSLSLSVDTLMPHTTNHSQGFSAPKTLYLEMWLAATFCIASSRNPSSACIKHLKQSTTG